MPVIDVHTHAFPDDLAGRAVSALEAAARWKAVLDGRVGSLLDSMDSARIEAAVVCAIATRPEQTEGIFNWCTSIRSERIIPFPSVHPDTPDAAGWMARIAGAHLRGIKLHPMYQDFDADEPRALALYRAAAEAELVVTLHCGRDIAFPDDGRAEPARIRRALEAVPEMTLIATHMGGWRMWDEAAAELIGTACHLETSFSMDDLPAGRIVEMIRAHGASKVMFGTDSPWQDQALSLARLRGLPLTEAELDAIDHANAARLLTL